MKRWSTTAWIFQAVAYASQDEPAKLDDVIACADAINHAIPTQKELQRSFGRLISNKLITKIGKSYSLTDEGRTLMDDCAKGRSRMHVTLEALTLKLPAGVKAPLDETVSESDVAEGFKAYEVRFKKIMNEQR
jgi:hypothetical protein